MGDQALQAAQVPRAAGTDTTAEFAARVSVPPAADRAGASVARRGTRKSDAVRRGTRNTDAVRRGTRNTVVLLVFTAITNLADGVIKIALPLLAAHASGSPAQVSAVSLSLSLPWLLVALHVGVLVDRVDRRRLLWGANALRLLALGALVRIATTDDVTIPVLCAVGTVLGVAEVIALITESALVPALVPVEGRERANTWIAGAETVCNEFCGPFVGGLLLAAGTGLALGMTWVSYLVAALVLLLLTGRFRAARDGGATETTGAVGSTGGTDAAGGTGAAGAAGAAGSVNRQIADGLRHLWRHTLLRRMSLIQTVLCACWGAWLALMPLFTTDVMRLGPRECGAVLSALGVGGLTGALAVTWVNRLLGHHRMMFTDVLGTFAMMTVPALTTSLWAVAAAAFAGGMGGTLWTVNARTIGQRLVPDAMLGRYNAAARLFSWGAMPVGAGTMGLLAEWLGLRPAFLVFGVFVAATVVPFLRVLTRPALAKAFGE